MAKKEGKDDKFLEVARERFDRCVEAESRNREQALEDLKFSEGDQWPDKIKTEREREGQPCLVLNRIPAFIRLAINDIRQSRPAIKTVGVDDTADPETAEIMNGIIRNIEQSSNAEIAYDWAAEYAIRCGWGYYEIFTKYVNDESFEQDIGIRRVPNPFSIYRDPESIEPDGSDMMFCFYSYELSKNDYDNKYPKAKCKSDFREGKGTCKEKWFLKDKVRLAKYWIVEEENAILSVMPDGETYIEPMKVEGASKTRKITRRRVKQYIINGHEILEQYDWAGKYIPLIPVFGNEINIEGETMLSGMVRDMKDAQRQYNYWRSASTERVALAPKTPYIGARGQFLSPKWGNANVKNYPYIEYDVVTTDEGVPLPPPQRQGPPEMSSGIIAETNSSADELKAISGIYDPSLGQQSNEISGVAINARQRQSGITNFHYMDNLARSLRHCGRVLVDLIPKIYDTARIVRIVGEDGQERQVTVNKQFIDEKDQKAKTFDLKTGNYDIVVDVGPSFATQRQEATQAMLEFTNNDPEAKALIGDLIAQNMDWKGADEVAKRLRMRLPAEIVGEENPQVKMAITQMQQQMGQLSELNKVLQQELQAMSVELRNKNEANQIKAAELQIKRGDLERKVEKDDDDYVLTAKELGLKYGINIE